ncbi:hypothetical protein O0L34_g7722 [Tuta absoluta]|nr:hypothetical protein O0L34_g7722 [Tuta absoluta]
MASTLIFLLSLAFFAAAFAAPVDQETTPDAIEDVELVEQLAIIQLVPVVGTITEDATNATESTPVASTEAAKAHKVAKRDTLRGDNPSNDLLAGFEGLKYENGLSSLDGRRIKFLPTWLG